jgi:ZIP family zinc transporter
LSGGAAIHAIIVLSIALGTFCATLLGGLAALRFSSKLHLILGFSAGAVVALAFFDLLPEAMRLGSPQPPQTFLSIAALAFFAYALLDRLVLRDSADGRRNAGRAWTGAGGLSLHSLLDGIALGIGFEASTSIGIVVAVAILAHDCADGMNTVSLVLKNGGTRRAAFNWLLVDAAAPVVGAGASLLVQPAVGWLASILAAFAGFFFYIGASDLLPDSYRASDKISTTAALLTGAAFLYGAVRFAG